MSMTRRRKFLAAVAGTAGLAVVGILLVVALAPRWVNLEAVRTRVLAVGSTALGGPLKYERIDLTWFPRPRVVVRKLEMSIPGKVSGTVRSVSVLPAFLPLLRGHVRLSKVAVDGLDVAVDLGAPSKEEKRAAPANADPFAGVRSLVADEGLSVGLDGRVVLARPGRGSLQVEGLRVDAAIRFSPATADVTLSRLSAESPRISVEGSLHVDGTAPRAEIAARGAGLDVANLRGKLLAFAGDVPVLQSVFTFLRGGTLTSWSLSAAGKTPADLGAFEAMSIRAAVAGARVWISLVGLDLAEVSADVSIDRGVLTAGHAAARVGRSKVSDGAVLVGLAGRDGRLKIDARFDADLAEIPSLLSRVLRSRTIHEELPRLERLEGRATGRITLGDRADDLKTAVRVSRMDFSASSRRIPWPVNVREGTFFFDGSRVGVSRLTGSVGRSALEGFGARVRLGKTPVIESASGTVAVQLDDVLAGLSSFEGMNELRTEVRRLKGTARISVNRLAGPVFHPKDWRFAARGTLGDILLETPLVPAPLEVKSGAFTLGERSLGVGDLDVRFLDATLRVSGSLDGDREGPPKIGATARGEVGPKTVAWGWERASLPADLRPRAPIVLQGVRLGLAGPGARSLAGTFAVARGPRVALDLTGGGDGIDVNDLTVTDGDAVASMALRHEAGALDIRFKGRLDGATIAKILEKGSRSRGRIEGDLRLLVPRGHLGGLKAEGNRLDVTSPSLVLDDQKFSVTGGATARDGGVDLDLDVSAGDLSWLGIEKVLDRLEEAKKRSNSDSSKAAGPGPLAVGGVVRLATRSFTFQKFLWKPVLAEVRLENDSVAATVRQADVCGVSMTGDARFPRAGPMQLRAQATAAGAEVNTLFACLGFEDIKATGRYEASLQIEANGDASELKRNLRGPVTFKAFKGEIGKANILTRLLGVLNATQVFAGRVPVGGTLPYDMLSVTGNLGGGSFSIREASLVTPAFTTAATGSVGTLDRSVNLQVLSHPLSTLDKIVKAIPVLRTILGANFLAVGATVTGTVDDPEIHVTPAKDVGAGLVGILERTITLPVKVVDQPSGENQ